MPRVLAVEDRAPRDFIAPRKHKQNLPSHHQYKDAQTEREQVQLTMRDKGEGLRQLTSGVLALSATPGRGLSRWRDAFRIHAFITTTTLMSWDPAICEEVAPLPPDAPRFEYDSGFRLTDRARRERQKVRLVHCHLDTTANRVTQRRDAYLAVRAPQLRLDRKLLPLLEHYDPDAPFLYYGLLVPHTELNRFVARHNIVLGNGQPITEDKTRDMLTHSAVSKYLQHKISLDLRIRMPFSAQDDVYVIALDDTQCLSSHILGEPWARKAQRTFRKVRKELNIPRSQKPMWHWSWSCGDRCVTSLLNDVVTISQRRIYIAMSAPCRSTILLRSTVVP